MRRASALGGWFAGISHPGDMLGPRGPVRLVSATLTGMRRADLRDRVERWPIASGLLMILVGVPLLVFGFVHNSLWTGVPGGIGVALVMGGATVLYRHVTRDRAITPYDRK